MERLDEENVIKAINEKPRLDDVIMPERLREFAQWAVKGQTMPMHDALREMTQGFMDNCGVSCSARTIYYDAGGAILERYMEHGDDELAQLLREKELDSFCQAMPLLHECYTKEEYDDYDVTALATEDYLIYCMDECDYNIPDKMKAALCYGVFLLLTSNK